MYASRAHFNVTKRRDAMRTFPVQAIKVFYHDDPPCSVRLQGGFCPSCKLYPDMQSLAFCYHCSHCDARLGDADMRFPQCSQCLRSLEYPDSR